MLMGRDIVASHFWNVKLLHLLANHSELTVGFCGLEMNPHKFKFKKNEIIYI
jgi:hypothetical protein